MITKQSDICVCFYLLAVGCEANPVFVSLPETNHVNCSMINRVILKYEKQKKKVLISSESTESERNMHFAEQ